MNLRQLSEVFDPSEIEWRIGTAGIKEGKGPWAKVLAYVTNRAIQQRLDDVCGIANWRNEFQAGPLGGVLCGISIKVDGEWVTKWDGADNTDFEAIKGGLSDSMKRAAVQWGIGRYLYRLGETWARFGEDGGHVAKIQDRWYRWFTPELPAWALPQQKQESETTTDGSIKTTQYAQFRQWVMDQLQHTDKYADLKSAMEALISMGHFKSRDDLMSCGDKFRFDNARQFISEAIASHNEAVEVFV